MYYKCKFRPSSFLTTVVQEENSNREIVLSFFGRFLWGGLQEYVKETGISFTQCVGTVRSFLGPLYPYTEKVGGLDVVSYTIGTRRTLITYEPYTDHVNFNRDLKIKIK